jgi:hypothetical protein
VAREAVWLAKPWGIFHVSSALCKGRQVANNEIAGVEAQQLVFADE